MRAPLFVVQWLMEPSCGWALGSHLGSACKPGSAAEVRWLEHDPFGYSGRMIDARTLARPLLASSFVAAGYQVLRNPAPFRPAAAEVGVPIAEVVGFPTDPLNLVRLNAAAQIGAGTLLAMGRLPRASALVLAASLVPTTLANHRFWESTNADERRTSTHQFLKNAAILGGLVLAALDTGRAALGVLEQPPLVQPHDREAQPGWVKRPVEQLRWPLPRVPRRSTNRAPQRSPDARRGWPTPPGSSRRRWCVRS